MYVGVCVCVCICKYVRGMLACIQTYMYVETYCSMQSDVLHNLPAIFGHLPQLETSNSSDPIARKNTREHAITRGRGLSRLVGGGISVSRSHM